LEALGEWSAEVSNARGGGSESSELVSLLLSSIGSGCPEEEAKLAGSGVIQNRPCVGCWSGCGGGGGGVVLCADNCEKGEEDNQELDEGHVGVAVYLQERKKKCVQIKKREVDVLRRRKKEKEKEKVAREKVERGSKTTDK